MENKEILEICSELHHHEDTIGKVRAQMPDEDRIDMLAELFRMFGDPTRIRILESLSEQELCVCDIAETLGMTVSAISHQLRLLKQARLVKSRREGKTVFYALSDAHVRTMLGQGMEHISE